MICRFSSCRASNFDTAISPVDDPIETLPALRIGLFIFEAFRDLNCPLHAPIIGGAIDYDRLRTFVLDEVMRCGRVLKAFLTAPAVTAVFFLICYALSWILTPEPDRHGRLDILQDVVSLLIIYGLFGAVVSALLGAPMYFLYRRLGWRSWQAFAIGGALIGCVTAISLDVLGMAMFLGSTPILAAYCSAAGLLSSLAFRAVAFGCGESST